MKSINDLAKKIANSEGLKKETSIANINSATNLQALLRVAAGTTTELRCEAQLPIENFQGARNA